MQNLFFGLLAAASFIGLAPFCEAGETRFGPLISAEKLEEFRSTRKIVILDIRGSAVTGGFIPGAISIDYGAFRGPPNNPGKLVTDEHLTDVLQKHGVDVDKRTVIVYQGKNETMPGQKMLVVK